MKHLKKEGLTDQLSLLEDSHAKTYHLQAEEKESLEKDQVFGRSLRGSSKMYGRNGRLLKMYQPYDLKDLHWSYKISTRSGTMRNGIAYPVPKLVGFTEEIAYGSSPSLQYPTPRVSDTEGGLVKNVELKDGKFSRKNKKGEKWGVKLKDAVNHLEKWPTPTTQEIEHPNAQLTETGRRLSKDGKSSHSLNLADKVRMFPTPNASDNRNRGNLSNPAVQRRLKKGKQLGLSMVVSPVSVQLNPEWVEWLMGYPKDYTLPEEETK